jgi:hypothetical protein
MYGGCIEVHAGRGQIRWREVPASYTHVFARVSAGSRYVDPMLGFNLAGIDDTDRLLIPYLVASAEPAELQCRNFAGNIGLRQGMATMVAADQQIGLGAPRPPKDIIHELVRWLHTATGRNPILRGAVVTDCPLVLTGPLASSSGAGDWLFRQTADPGVVPGVPNGRLEQVWWNGTEDELAQFYRSGALPADRSGADDSAAERGAAADDVML